MKTRCEAFAVRCREYATGLQPFLDQYGSSDEESTPLMRGLFGGIRMGNLGMLKDLHDLHTMTGHLGVGFFALKQAGNALQDAALRKAATMRMEELSLEQEWLNREIRAIAAQALVVPSMYNLEHTRRLS